MDDLFRWLAQPYHLPEQWTNGTFFLWLGASLLLAGMLGLVVGVRIGWNAAGGDS